MKKFLVVLIIAAAAGYGLLSYHFVLLDSSVKILKKPVFDMKTLLSTPGELKKWNWH